MELASQLSNSIAYAIHSATYNPDAEQFAKENSEKAKKEADTNKAKAEQDKAVKEKADALAKAKAEEERIENERKSRATFSLARLFGTTFGIVTTVVLSFLLVVLGVFGASLATNLNLYHSMPYKIFYAIYGFLFFFIVIPYVLIYRWYWKGLRPKFYALIPILPYRLDNKWAAMLFSWLSYKPDEDIELLKEWNR